MKLGICVFFENVLTKNKVHLNWARITFTVNEDQYIYIFGLIFLTPS